jgi:hypothetical protein
VGKSKKKKVNFKIERDVSNIYQRFKFICREGRDIKLLPRGKVTVQDTSIPIDEGLVYDPSFSLQINLTYLLAKQGIAMNEINSHSLFVKLPFNYWLDLQDPLFSEIIETTELSFETICLGHYYNKQLFMR